MGAARYQPLHEQDERADDVELEGWEQDIDDLDPLSAPEPPDYKRMILWIIGFFVINNFASGLIAVPRINLVVSLVCRQTIAAKDPTAAISIIVGGDNAACKEGEISSLVAGFASWGNLIAGVLAAVVGPYLAKRSDRIGRIKILMFNLGGIILTEALLVTIAQFHEQLGYHWLYLAYITDGLSGSFTVLMSMSSAYISDCVPADERNVQIGRVHATMFLGYGIGPLFSSSIVSLGGNQSLFLVFYVCLALRTLCLIYLKFVPESAASAKNAPWSLLFTSSNPGAQRHQFSLVKLLGKLNPRAWLERIVPTPNRENAYYTKNVMLLLCINLSIYAAVVGTGELLVLYPQLVFKWGSVENNTYMTIVNGLRAAVSAFVLPLLVKIFRGPGAVDPAPNASNHPIGGDIVDRTLLRTAIAVDMIGFIGYALSPSGVLFTVCGALAAFGAIGLSTTEATLSKHVVPSRIGEMMGGLGFLQAIVRVIAPTVVNIFYSWTAESIPQLSFWGVAVTLSVGLFLSKFLQVRLSTGM